MTSIPFASYEPTHSHTDRAARAMRAGLRIGKCADPTESERIGLTVDEAVEIAREDVSLLYVELSA